MRLLLLLDMRSLLGQVMESPSAPDWQKVILASVKALTTKTSSSSPPLEISSRKSRHYKDLQLQCTNADPNYGVLWFFCKLNPFDPARQVLASSRRMMQHEVYNESVSALYFHAMLRKQILASGHAPSCLPSITPPASCNLDDFTTGIISTNRPAKTTMKLLFGSRDFLLGHKTNPGIMNLVLGNKNSIAGERKLCAGE